MTRTFGIRLRALLAPNTQPRMSDAGATFTQLVGRLGIAACPNLQMAKDNQPALLYAFIFFGFARPA